MELVKIASAPALQQRVGLFGSRYYSALEGVEENGMSEDAKQQLERPTIAFHVRSTGSIAEQPFHGIGTPRHARQFSSKTARRRTRDLRWSAGDKDSTVLAR